MRVNHLLSLLVGVLTLVLGSNAFGVTTSVDKNIATTLSVHGVPTTLSTNTKSTTGMTDGPNIIGVPRHSTGITFDTGLQPTMPLAFPFGNDNSTPLADALLPRDQKFKCEAGDKLMSYKSARCDGREYYACCPRGWQAAFGEDCVGLPSCKYDPKNGKPTLQWPGRTPNGCVNCADGYAAVSGFYGGCMKEPLPESFKNGKCTGPAGNKCI